MNNTSYTNYNIGLDIGTNSVGWAVTNEYGELLRMKGKNAFGSRLFEAGKTAKAKRLQRGARRRTRRRQYRIQLLQSLFEPQIIEKDPSFFIRLNNSYKIEKGKSSILFNDFDYNDQSYYADYPTIYHLRKDLIEKSQAFDIRMIYLACAHIIKYRGHFLFNQNFDFHHLTLLDNLYSLQQKYNIEFSTKDLQNIEEILLNPSLSRAIKKDKLKEEIVDKSNSYFKSALEASLGYKKNLKAIFPDLNSELNDKKLEINSEQFEEFIMEFQDELEEYQYDCLILLKQISTIITLSTIIDLEDSSPAILSSKMVKTYEAHKSELEQLKVNVKKYCPDQYEKFFKTEGTGYQQYITNGGPKSLDNLYKEVKNIIAYFPESERERISNLMDDKKYLLKQKMFLNAAIPNQIHEQELKLILENQGQFYPFLNEIKDKLLKLLRFRIPYYAGPLVDSKYSPYAWVIKKKDESITPWNFEEIIDKEATATQFIKRMTVKDTYLFIEDVLPKNSMIYQLYEVLNELNNMHILVENKPVYLSCAVKQEIMTQLFMKKKKVSIKDVKNYLITHGYFKGKISITGLSDKEKFLSSLSTIIDMKKVFGDAFLRKENWKQFQMIEKIIEWSTIFEDRYILEEKLKNLDLSTQQIDLLLAMRYKGWGKFSYKLLCGLKSKNNKQRDVSILELMWDTNKNFMQIYHSKQYSFEEQVNQLNEGIEEDEQELLKQVSHNPAIYRGINQALKIVDEIIQLKGYEPSNIYIEFARENKGNDDSKSRVKKLKAIFSKNKDSDLDCKQLLDELKSYDKIENEKIYLYFLQCGKCLYTGEPLNIHTLSTECEIDHIWPQSYVTDNSLDNKALVKKVENQQKTNQGTLKPNIIHKQKAFWNKLCENGLMSNVKLSRLMKTELSDEQIEGFIQRQLVETRQIVKLLTNILCRKYENTKIIALRASLVTQFRKRFDLYKIRKMNHYHHAHDAYLLSVIGEYLQANMSKSESEAMEYGKYIYKQLKKKIDLVTKQKTLLYFLKEYLPMKDDQKLYISDIKKVLEYKQCNISYKVEFNTKGEFYNQTIVSAKNAVKGNTIPLRKGWDVKKYGGYTGINSAYTILVKNLKKKKTTYERISIPTYIADACDTKDKINAYLSEKLSYPFEVICYHLGKNQKIRLNGSKKETYYLSSYQEYTSARELCLPLVLQKPIAQAYTELKYYSMVSNETAESLKKVFDFLHKEIEEQFTFKFSNSMPWQEMEELFEQEDNNGKLMTIDSMLDFCSAKTNRKSIVFYKKDGSGEAKVYPAYSSKRLSGKTMSSGDEVIFQSVTGLVEKRVIL